jgi:hypothetical protein
MRFVARLFSGIGLAVVLVQPASAQSDAAFAQKDICVVKGKKAFIDRDKLIVATITGAKPSDIEKDGKLGHSAREFRDYAVTQNRLQNFVQAPGDYYTIHRKDKGAVSAEDLLDNFSQYEAICVGWPRETVANPLREAINKATKDAGSKLILRKDVDNLSVGLKKAQPAKFSMARDEVGNNTLMQSELALATEFVTHLGMSDTGATMPVFFRPYVRYVGKFNSKSSLKDVDNLGFGLRADLYSLSLFDIVNSKLSLRGEYLTDSVAESEIAAGEVVWTPHFKNPVLRRYLPLGEEIELFGGGPDGLRMSLDVSGRFRFGEVYDPGQTPTLLATNQYRRLGARARADFGFGGSDVLSGITFFVDYLYFNNLRDGSGIDSFYKFEVGLAYAITDNVGVSVGYVRGRDEDKLVEIDRVEANLTVKFGEPLR